MNKQIIKIIKLILSVIILLAEIFGIGYLTSVIPIDHWAYVPTFISFAIIWTITGLIVIWHLVKSFDSNDYY